MTKEAFALLKSMDIGAVDTQLALYCAPLLTGIKVSNLLMIQLEQLGRVQQIFSHTGISCYTLYRGRQKTALLLYRQGLLNRYLKKDDVKELFRQLGYDDFVFGHMLHAFAGRYMAHMEKKAGFPHEMGLFLGYPAEDVRGFLENSGRNFLYAGYWKVYENKAEKMQLFQQFDQAKERMLSLVAGGTKISEIIT